MATTPTTTAQDFAATRIIQQGEEAKFRITIDDFDMQEGQFQLELFYGMLGKRLTITKQEMIDAANGDYYFIFDTTPMTGLVIARCTWWVADTDEPTDSLRQKQDEQYLCFVSPVACPTFCKCPACTQEHPVTYERTDQSDIASKYSRLCDCYGHPFATDDDLYLYVLTEKAEEIFSNNP